MDHFHRLLHDLWEGESQLAAELAGLAEDVPTDGRLGEEARRFAVRSAAHAQWLARLVEPDPVQLAPDGEPFGPGPVRPLPARTGPGRCPDRALAVLHGLRRVHAMAGDNLLVWDALACAAAARGDRGVLELAALCRPTALRQSAWSRERLRARAALALTGRPQSWRRQEAVRLALARTAVPGDCADVPEPGVSEAGVPDVGGRA